MGHKSWGGARPNKWDRQFHEESKEGRFHVELRSGTCVVIDSSSKEVVFENSSIIRCEMECELLNEQEEA